MKMLTGSVVFIPILMSLSGALVSCATTSNDVRASVSLERTECFGPRCPVYRFTLYSDGRYVWDGRAHVSVKGVVRGSMDPKVYATAMQLLRDAQYQEFTGDLVCEIWATDNPTVKIVVTDASGQQTISHYMGCQGFSRQEDLTKLEDNLDKVFRTRRFIR